MNRVFGIAVLAGLAACGVENLPPVETDVLVVGGTAKGVAAAVAAKAEGADVWSHVHIQHQIPNQHGLTPLVNGAQSNILHILNQAL